MLREPQKHKKTKKFDKNHTNLTHSYTKNEHRIKSQKNNNNERVCVRVFKAAADTQKQHHQ
jgi:hypothetical protein